MWGFMKQVKYSYRNWKNTKAGKLLKTACGIALVMAVLLAFGCSFSEPANSKIGSLLQTQVDLKKEQMANPTVECLQVMQNMVGLTSTVGMALEAHTSTALMAIMT